ncbi:MAG: cobalamin-binding protein [Thermoplasmata archaeon]
MRIVSLLPAATEICFALGLGPDVVGVSPECDYPPAALDKRVVSRVLMDYEGKTSAETSRMVGERLETGGALYEVDEAALRELEPDLILTQGLCEVCAPSIGDVKDVASRLPKKPEVLSLDPHGLRDLLEDIRRVGKACGAEEAAEASIAGLRERMAAIALRTTKIQRRPKVLCLEWLDPLFLAGHWVPEMVELAGGTNVIAVPGEKSRRVEPKGVVMASPDVAILMPCGFHMDRTIKEAPTVAGRPWWSDLPAARREQVWLVDGSSYFNRPGPRVVDGLEILAHILHPQEFPKTWSSKDVQRWTR